MRALATAWIALPWESSAAASSPPRAVTSVAPDPRVAASFADSSPGSDSAATVAPPVPSERPDTLPAAPSAVPPARGPGNERVVLMKMSTLAGSGDGPGQVIEPAGMAVNSMGQVYVSDAALHRLQWFDRAGRLLGETGALGSDPGQMRRPGSVVVLGGLGVAVLDRENRRVLTYDFFGRRLGVAVDLGSPELERQLGRVDPTGLAADRGGALFVVDAARERILAFDFAGRFRRAIGGFGPTPGSFRGLRAVAVAPRGDLVTVEVSSARVQRLGQDGSVRATWRLPLPARSATAGELAVAVDDSGGVAVADEAAGAVWIFRANGALLAERHDFLRPRAVAFAPGVLGSLLVAETAPGRVARWAVRIAVVDEIKAEPNPSLELRGRKP